MLLRVETAALQCVIGTVGARRAAASQYFVALLAAVRFGRERQLQLLQEGAVEVEDLVAVGVDEGDSVLGLVELHEVQLDVVTARPLKRPARAHDVVEPLGEQVEQRVESLSL